jgi:hypothetical protein
MLNSPEKGKCEVAPIKARRTAMSAARMGLELEELKRGSSFSGFGVIPLSAKAKELREKCRLCPYSPLESSGQCAGISCLDMLPAIRRDS